MNLDDKLSDEELIDSTNQMELIWLANYAEQSGVNCLKANVIDIGCGFGIITMALSHHFNTVYGIDIDNTMLKNARQNKNRLSNITEEWNGLKKLRFYLGSFLEIPIKKVEIVCMFNSLHFSDNIHLALDNAFFHIKPGGLLFISEPNYKSKFCNKIMENKSALKSKLERIDMTRKLIRTYMQETSVDVIIEQETPIEYFVIMRKDW